MVRGDHVRSIAWQIEQYLKAMLERASNGVIEVQRSALSELFNCAPSQINYVLSTRFTLAHGYVVETRRGGGGYVRIVRINLSADERLRRFLKEILDEGINENEAQGFIEFLQEEGILTNRESNLLKNICSDRVLSRAVTNANELRSNILQSVLITILREDV